MPGGIEGDFGMTTATARYLRRADAAHYVRATWGLPCSAKWLAKLAVVLCLAAAVSYAGFRWLPPAGALALVAMLIIALWPIQKRIFAAPNH